MLRTPSGIAGQQTKCSTVAASLMSLETGEPGPFLSVLPGVGAGGATVVRGHLQAMHTQKWGSVLGQMRQQTQIRHPGMLMLTVTHSMLK